MQKFVTQRYRKLKLNQLNDNDLIGNQCHHMAWPVVKLPKYELFFENLFHKMLEWKKNRFFYPVHYYIPCMRAQGFLQRNIILSDILIKL